MTEYSFNAMLLFMIIIIILQAPSRLALRLAPTASSTLLSLSSTVCVTSRAQEASTRFDAVACSSSSLRLAATDAAFVRRRTQREYELLFFVLEYN